MTGFHELVYPELEKKQLTGYIIISTISGVVGICLTYLVGHFLDLIIASCQEREWVEYIVVYVGLNIINRICYIRMEYQRVSIEGKLSYGMLLYIVFLTAAVLLISFIVKTKMNALMICAAFCMTGIVQTTASDGTGKGIVEWLPQLSALTLLMLLAGCILIRIRED